MQRTADVLVAIAATIVVGAVLGIGASVLYDLGGAF